MVEDQAAAAQRPSQDDDGPEERPGYPGAVFSLLRDVSEAAGFAFAELWTRPYREELEDNDVALEWDHLLKFADVTYTNHRAWPEARSIAGKLDEFKRAGRDTSYAKANSIPGLAWNRGEFDWQDLTVYDMLDETIQADLRVTEYAMDMFDASIAIPARHPVYKKTCAVLVFYRNRHVAKRAAVWNVPQFHKHPAMVEVFNNAARLAPLAVEYDMAMPHWDSVQEKFYQENAQPAARSGDAGVASQDIPARRNVRQLRSVWTMLTEREEFKRLSATEAEWEKGEFAGWLKTYINKCKGAGGVPAKGTDYTYCKWVALGSVAALGIMSFIDDTVDEYAFGGGYTLYALLTHFSSVALLLFSTPTSPFAQPRNLVGGHLISAVCVCVSP
jgi:hypothetical protein